VPIERIRQQAAQQHADAAAARKQTKPNTPIALARSAPSANNCMINDSATGVDDRPAESLQRSCREQECTRTGQPTGQRGKREYRECRSGTAGDAEQVPERPPSSRSLRGEQIGVDHPGERCLGELQVGPDRMASATFTIVMSSTIISTPRQKHGQCAQRPACESEAICCIVSHLPQDGPAVHPLVFAACGICREDNQIPCNSGRPDRHMKRKVCIVGGGPAGMMLGYLLGRAGIDTCVLEKQRGFSCANFRGDTVHPSTLQIMHELGLLEEFLKLPHL